MTSERLAAPALGLDVAGVVEFKADMPRIAEPPSLATSVRARQPYSR
jgi:hypothetical protein